MELVTTDQGSQVLSRLETACRALSEAKTFEEVKDIRDKAQAIRQYVKEQGYGLDAQNTAAELKLRAERKLGLLLSKGPGRGTYGGDRKSSDIVSLEEVGVHRKQSSRWQRIASIKELVFETRIKEAKESKEELTSAGMLRLAKAIKKQEKLTSISECELETCTIADLVNAAASGKRFGTIYADPPWRYGNQATRASTDNHYPTMTVDEIAALPVGELAAKDCHLHLWTTNAFLFECPKILDAWGFEYKSVLVWVKPQMGIGNYWRVSHEFLILGVRGDAAFGNRSQKSWIHTKRTGHSRKPKAVRALLEKVSPPPRLELFARSSVDGWAVWGNEIERGSFFAAPTEEVVDQAEPKILFDEDVKEI